MTVGSTLTSSSWEHAQAKCRGIILVLSTVSNVYHRIMEHVQSNFWCSWIWSKMPADVTRGRKPGNRPIYITSFYPLFYTLILKLLRLVSSVFWPGVGDENFAVRNAARWCVMGGEFCLPYCCPCQYVNSANGGINGGISGISGDVFQSNPGLDAGSRQRQAMGDGGHESCQDPWSPWRPETINSMRFDDEIRWWCFTQKILKASYCQGVVFVAQCPSPTQASSIGFGRGLKPFSSSAAVSRCKMQTAHETIVNSSLKHC